MRFMNNFIRWKTNLDTRYQELGSDEAALITANAYSVGLRDCIFSFRSYSLQNMPIKRIGLAYKPPSGTTQLQVGLYVYDQSTRQWYLNEAKKNITPLELLYFDFPAISSITSTDTHSQGNSSVTLAVIAEDAAVAAGLHQFSIFPVIN